MLRAEAIANRMVVVFLIILALNALGCASPPMVVLEDYYYDRVLLDEAKTYVKAELDQAGPILGNESSCRIPAFAWPDRTIVRVEPSLAKLDVRPGDRIVMLDGKQDNNWQSSLLLITNHRPNEELDLRVVRDGVELQRKVKCVDGQPLRDAWIAALGAASKGRWDQCTGLSDELDKPPLSQFSGIVLLHYYCQQADRISSHYIATEADATVLYGARMLQLQEAKYVPGGLEKIKGDVSEAIHWFERNNFRPFATSLTEELEKRTSR